MHHNACSTITGVYNHGWFGKVLLKERGTGCPGVSSFFGGGGDSIHILYKVLGKRSAQLDMLYKTPGGGGRLQNKKCPDVYVWYLKTDPF